MLVKVCNHPPILVALGFCPKANGSGRLIRMRGRMQPLAAQGVMNFRRGVLPIFKRIPANTQRPRPGIDPHRRADTRDQQGFRVELSPDVP